MLAHIPIVILASLPVMPVADRVPTFDIARECRSEGGPKAVLEKCTADEVDARDKLQPLWVQFNPREKAVCIGETSSDGTPSYVELLTCLEMARDARKPTK